MKKSLLNIAVTLALSSAVFSGSVLSTQAYAGELSPDNNNSNANPSETYMYPGMGVGAATGALAAGPVGLIIGGVVGAFVGSNQEVTPDQETGTRDEIVVSTSEQAINVKENIEHSPQAAADKQEDTGTL
jgi:hypothetical protein